MEYVTTGKQIFVSSSYLKHFVRRKKRQNSGNVRRETPGASSTTDSISGMELVDDTGDHQNSRNHEDLDNNTKSKSSQQEKKSLSDPVVEKLLLSTSDEQNSAKYEDSGSNNYSENSQGKSEALSESVEEKNTFLRGIEQNSTNYEDPENSNNSKNSQKGEIVALSESEEENKLTYISFLNDLNLNPCVKLTLRKARTVDKHTLIDETLISTDQIPDYLVKKLMIVDYRARSLQLNSENIQQEENSRDELSDDEDDENRETNGQLMKETVNPMDAVLAVFHSSDDFLRQVLAIKLSACQQSVPFLLPDPEQPSEKITMLLWALGAIKKSWKVTTDINKNTRARHVFVLEHPFPIVSFVRIGRNRISKSALMNKVMSDVNGYNDFFFHKDCEGGGVERRFVDGLLELCWYLPGERKQQAFQHEICFANLRGDAENFKKQLSVVTKISSVIFFLLPSEYLQQSTAETLEQIVKTTEAKVFLVFYGKPQADVKQYFRNLTRENPGKLSSILRVSRANEADFVKDIRQQIHQNISQATSPLANLASFASEIGIDLDEKHEVNLTWRQRIAEWLQLGPKQAKLGLKLQTVVPTIANLERENFRPKRHSNKTDKERIDEIYSKHEATKNSQKQLVSEMDETICKILNYIVDMNPIERDYALTILKHDLDKMSLDVLGSLQAQYKDAWINSQIKKKERRLDSSEHHPPSPEEQHLKELETLIEKSSFGLEHIIREIAQVFQLTEISLVNYPGTAADILLSGQPLEIMDGDSSYIPIKWFNAVFTQLVHKTKDAKLFVISVLGIQSSGKSTMLNTMFGLEFPVSAGRCTRGAFASLIPVSDALKSASNVDYVLIIDTEGLRGSGDPKAREHDNELATFAIGVADLTIVNIFGENYNSMKEFLEIAVHAFLKMELVKEKRICQIVHQNVAAVEASDVLATERITLKRKLDEMAKLAAIQEKCEDAFQELNDILSFDENEDVFYIPNLLQGSPPMARVNPDYGRCIQKVREKIVSLMCLPERSTFSISQFQTRVCDLWKAIQRENFIFSFRNTIEVRAYTSLDKKFFEESIKTMVTGMAKLEKRVQVSLMRSSADGRQGVWSVSKMEISEKAEELGKNMERAMEVFFETNEDKATLEQWRENFMIRILDMKENQKNQVIKTCEATFTYWQNREKVDMEKQTYKKKLLEKAKKLIEDTKDAKKGKAKFEEEWKQWINGVPDCKDKKIDVNREMIDVLQRSGHQKLSGHMPEKLGKQSYQIVNFKGSRPSIDNLNVGKWETVKSVFRDNPQLLIDAETIRDQAINAARDFARNTVRSGVRCRSDDLKQMYHLVLDTISEGTKKQPFKFPDSLLCNILLFSFAITYNAFCEMEERYFQERDIKGELERNLRPELQEYFLNMCEKMEKEVLAANSVVNVLKKAIDSELNKSMGPAVAGEILKKNEFQSKGQFHAKVLITLGEQRKFASYKAYLRNPVEFLKMQLNQSIKDYCVKPAKSDNSINLLLESEVKKIKDQVLSAISHAARLTKEINGTFSVWIERFVENCSTLEITAEMFAVATIDDNLKDFEMFESKVLQYVTGFFQVLVERGVNEKIYKTWKPSPHEKLLDLMFGCQECCPFCKGLCDQTARNHYGGHSTRIHRPQGITGFSYIGTDVLLSRICTTSVASDRSFKNIDTSDKWHPYKDYQSVNDYYKSWSIPPDPSFEASLYWKWFMATFSQQLAEYYSLKPPEIPTAWQNISFDDAKKQLRKEYNLV